MTDDNLDDTQQSSVGKQDSTAFKLSKDLIVTTEGFYDKFTWNAAIEAAASIAYHGGPSEIRQLKK